MKLLIWVAERYGKFMANLDWYGWHPWLGVRRIIVVVGCFYAITALLLAQEVVQPASAERIGRLEVQVGRLEAEAEKTEELHRADVALLTAEQQDLREDVVEGQATLTASLRTIEMAWSVIAGLLFLYTLLSTARKSWNGSRTWVRDYWQKRYHHNGT